MAKNSIKKPIVIAEIGCNHLGDIEVAKKMIRIAREFCDLEIVKFQKRTPIELLTPEEYKKPHPNPNNSYGKTYGEHREFLEFSKTQHLQLKKFCEKIGIEYFTSVWDMTSAKDIVSLQPKKIKIPSACNTDFTMLEYLSKNYRGEIHLSLGMTTRQEEKDIIKIFTKNNRLKDLILYVCTSGYPVGFNDVCLMEIQRLRKVYGNVIKDIGFSGHHLGIAIDIAAYTLGANYIERHFTLDRTLKGTDHAASLEPDMIRKLNRDLIATYNALKYKQKEILDIEIEQRRKLKRFNNNKEINPVNNQQKKYKFQKTRKYMSKGKKFDLFDVSGSV